MSTLWKKISHTHKKNHHGSVTSLRIQDSWPNMGEDINKARALENPKKAYEWRLVETRHEIAYYFKLQNKLHFGQA
eukprot:4364613-Ditylum_brightwellii.AAC.1